MELNATARLGSRDPSEETVAAGGVRCRHPRPNLDFGLTVFGEQEGSSMREASLRYKSIEQEV